MWGEQVVTETLKKGERFQELTENSILKLEILETCNRVAFVLQVCLLILHWFCWCSARM